MPEAADPQGFLQGVGEVRALLRDAEASRSPLGAPALWSGALRSTATLVLDAAFPMFLAWGPQRALLYNDAYAKILGRKHPDALGRPIAEVWDEAWDTMAPLLDRALAGEPLFLENLAVRTRRHGDEEEAFFTLSYSPARSESGAIRGVFCAVVETTGQVRADFDLRQLAQTLGQRAEERAEERDLIWQVSRDMLLVADCDGRWLSVNPAWTRVLGWTEAELVGRTSDWLEHPGDDGRTRAEVEKLARGMTTAEFENRLRTKEGDYRTLSWSAVPENGRLYCVARDVTEERRKAANLRLFENIVESASAPICAFDTEFRLIAFNKAHGDEFFRVQNRRVRVGDVFPDHFTPDQASAIRGFMARALTGETFTVVEAFGDPAIEVPHWEISYSPIRDEAGRIVGAFHYAQDITERLKAQAELEGAQEALRQSQKMEAVGQLTGGLAHDFNNLLAGISGSLEMMRTRIRQGRHVEIDRYIDGAQASAKRAAALTHRLLAFSRRQTLAPKPTDVNRLVAGMEDLIGRTVGPQIAVETVAAAGLWSTLVDPNQLENALLNLAINARDAMPDGGRIVIETANLALDVRAARDRDLQPGAYVALSVSDNGSGMAKEVFDKAFDPFFTTKPIGVGTGLGLSMIYGFARQSGGQVRIHSELGRGTTVRIYLPMHDVEEAVEAPVVAEPIARADTVRTVLVIDDEPLVRMLVVDAVEDLGYTAIEAGDGPEGLEVLRSRTPLDLLVTDVGLPNGMNGRQVADAARELRPDLKVLFVTGYAENAVLSHGHLDPGMQVVTKPFDMTALARRIQDLVAG